MNQKFTMNFDTRLHTPKRITKLNFYFFIFISYSRISREKK